MCMNYQTIVGGGLIVLVGCYLASQDVKNRDSEKESLSFEGLLGYAIIFAGVTACIWGVFE
jgi:hypothetical protein